MPWASVEDLKKSDLYKRMKSLHAMGSDRLRRFISVFGEVHARAIRGGASEDEAEARAIPIALTAARKAVAPPAGRTAEAKVHYFALMATHMEHGGGGDVLDTVSTDLRFPDAEDINSVMAGQAFYGPAHRDSEPDIAEPQGVIRSVMAAKDLPDEVRAKVDPAIRLVAAASFFDDVPESERLSTISPEWMEFTAKDGSVLAVPHNFVTTPDPANPAYMGIGKVAGEAVDTKHEIRVVGDKVVHTMTATYAASADLEKPYHNGGVVVPQGVPHMPKPAEGQHQEQAQPDEGWQKKAESLQKGLDSVTQRLAALAGVEKPEAANPDSVIKAIEQRVASVEGKLVEAQRLASELVMADKQRSAEDFAEKLIVEKEVPTDAKPEWASLHLADPERAKRLAASLSPRALKPGAPKAASAIVAGAGDRERQAILHEIDPKRFKAVA